MSGSFVRRFLVLVVLAVVLPLLPGQPAGAAAAPTARFTWEMEQRYVDSTGDGYLDPRRRPDAVQSPFRVHFDACGSTGGGSTIRTYRWKFGSDVTTTDDCQLTRSFRKEGEVRVELTVITANGGRDVARQPVKVKDLLVVSIGDSIASGEGNPYATEHLVDADLNGNEVKIPIDATWQDERCHRSAVAGPAQAARHLETTSDRTSVTFVHLACSGASIADPVPGDDLADGGLIDPYVGIEPTGGAPLPPQLTQLKQLVGNRTIDVLMISIGANDMLFSQVVKNCLINIFGCHKKNPVVFDAADIWDARSPLLGPLYNKLRKRIAQVGLQVAAEDIYVTEYFDPTPSEAGTTCAPLVEGLIDGPEAAWASKTVVGGMNQIIKRKVDAFGWNFVSGIVKAYKGAPGHGYCAEPHWVVRLEESFVNQADKEGSFHPCAPGHGAYRDSLVTSLITNLDRQIRPTQRGKDIVTGVECNSPPEHFLNNRDGDEFGLGGLSFPIPDVIDNCPNMANPDQNDSDGNQVGDACQGYVVNSTGDSGDPDLNDGDCPKACTLRAAIQQALHEKGKHNRITFAITDSVGPVFLGGSRTISPGSRLPAIEGKGLIIDASTQPMIGAFFLGARCAPWTGHPCVELDGSLAQCGVPCSGLFFGTGSDASTVRAMAINRWSGNGIHASPVPGQDCDSASGLHLFEGNYIGTDLTGRLDLGNGRDGIALQHSGGNFIGGEEGWQRNLISGNGDNGLSMSGACGGGNKVFGNFIGTDVTGADDLGNEANGVVANSRNNRIGDGAPGFLNVISGNGSNGVELFNAGGNLVQGNYIGTQRDGGTALPNDAHGVLVYDNFDNDVIGGDPVDGNIIAFNREDGVNVYGGTGHDILSNSIFSNGSPRGLGINLQDGGVDHGEVSPNDPDDTDSGPNGTQNFPVLTSVHGTATTTTVQGTLSSAPSTPYVLQFFSSSACDPSRHGEGTTYVGRVQLTTNGAGDLIFNRTYQVGLPVGAVVTATATGPEGTSEFSVGHDRQGPCAATHIVNAPDDTSDGDLDDAVCDTGSEETGLTGVCTLRAAIQESNDAPGRDTIIFAIGSGPVTLEPGPVLPEITDPVVIDATTQPGSNGRPIVEIDGSGTGFPDQAFAIDTDDTVIKGFVINRFADIAIFVSGDGNRISGNWVGVDSAGHNAAGNRYGIWLDGATDTVIGGTNPSDRNVISANTNDGIVLYAGNEGTVIQGNYIGVDPTGEVALGNGQNGIWVGGATDTTVGGTTDATSNLVSANGRHGILVGATGTTVRRNVLGLNRSGNVAMANLRNGIWLSEAVDSLVSNNVVAHSGWAGIRVSGNEADLNRLRGNLVSGSGGLGIDLHLEGLTLNDTGDADVGANGVQNFPVVTGVVRGTGVKVSGTLDALPGTYVVEVFRSATCDASDHGEAETYVGQVQVVVGGSPASFQLTLPASVPTGSWLTTTATGPTGTSELSRCVRVPA
ncbi:NosD domain-containing protein [Nocardioides stalactiti]|uniref:NosD domain-containing protein n=1 Tax=Nocardioides stalactiti TaxID=2755356 RepID=UPI0015FFDD54|nr:NosD domain-containing protein [Nocardioides stalactiti]